MTAEKKLKSYPREYLWFFERAAREEFSMACDSDKQARTLRSDLYNFRTVFCREMAGSHECRMLHSVSIEVDGRMVVGKPL